MIEYQIGYFDNRIYHNQPNDLYKVSSDLFDFFKMLSS